MVRPPGIWVYKESRSWAVNVPLYSSVRSVAPEKEIRIVAEDW